MSGPWEKYQAQQSGQGGPWTNYQKAAPSQPRTVEQFFSGVLDRALKNKGGPSAVVDEAKRVFSSVNEDYLAGALGLPVDAANWLLKQVDLGSESPVMGSDWLREQSRNIGASQEGYRPQTDIGRYVAAALGGAGAGAAGGALLGVGMMGAGAAMNSPATIAAGRASITPALDAAAGAGAGIGGQAADDIAPGSVTAQVAGQFLGGMVGGGLAAWPKSTAGATIDAFDKTGVPPTMGSTGGRSAGYLQNNVLEQSFGGGNVVDDALAGSRSAMDDAVKRIADQYSPQPYTTAVEAGDALKDQLASRFDMVKTATGRVYDRIDSSFGPNEVFLARNTLQALQDPVGKIDHKALSELLTDPQIKKFLDALQTTNGQVSYPTIKGFRSAVGNMLDPRQTAGVSNAQLKKLYGALSDDMQDIVGTRAPDIVRRWRSANALYKDTLDKFRQHWGAFVGNDKKFVPPERAYEMLLGSAEGNYERFLSVWKGLKPGQKGNFAATMLLEMGKSNDPTQPFSVKQFLKNYEGLGEQQKTLLFRGTNNGAAAQAIDDLLRVVRSFARNVEETLPRGKSASILQVAAQGGGLYRGVEMLFTGQPVAGLATILGATAGPYAAAKLMTNPTATRGLARGLAAVKAGKLPAAKVTALFQAFAEPDQKEPMRVSVPNLNGAQSQ